MIKSLYFAFLIIAFFSCGKQSHEGNVELTEETEAVEKWITSAKDSTQLSIEERKLFLEQAQKVALKITNDTIQLNKLSRISLAYKGLSDSLEFRKSNTYVLRLSENKKAYKILGDSHWDLATFFQSYGALDSAFYHYKKALKSFERLPDSYSSRSLRGKMLYSMGRIQDAYKDYLGAETSITSALKIFNGLEDIKRIYNCYNMLGIIASGMNNHEKSLEYFEKASSYLKMLESSNKIEDVWQNQNNIAREFLRMGDYSEAKKAYNELFQDPSLKTKDPELYSLALVSQAYSIFKGENNIEGAHSLLNEAMKINDSIGYSYDQARAKQYYAELLAAQGDTANARNNAKESLELAEETSNNDRHLEVLRLLTNLDRENATAYSNAYYNLSEQIKDEERAKRDKFARIRLETDEVIQENELLTRQKQIWLGAALGLVLLGLALLIIVSQRIHNNRLKFKQKQQESNQEIYNLMLSQQGKFREGKQLEQKRISEELHDGILGQMLGIRLILSGLNEKDDEASVEQRADLIEKLREVEEEIRTISHELSDASYQKFYNFIVSLEDLINDISKSSGIACSFIYSQKVDWDNLQGDLKINIYRIVQESLQNCVKHAQCKNVIIGFELDGDILKLSITDDGIGFDSNKGKKGIGLRNVASRVEKIKGTLKINSTKGEGTSIIVDIPSSYIKQSESTNKMKRRQAVNA